MLYSQIRSGFRDQGIVLLGNLYTWDRITQADVTDTEETQEIKVELTVKKVSRFVYFTTAQRDEVEAMLTRYEQERAELEQTAIKSVLENILGKFSMEVSVNSFA